MRVSKLVKVSVPASAHTLISVTPVPVVRNGSLATVEGQVADRELLITSRPTNLSTVKDKIANKTGRAFFRKDTLMLGTRLAVKVEDQILKASCLRSWPVLNKLEYWSLTSML